MAGSQDRRVSIRERNRNATREHLLDVAARLFTKRGYHATTIDHLAAEAGSSRATVYAYFASKDEILVAMSTEMFERTAETYVSLAAIADHSPASMRAWLTEVGEAWEANHDRTTAVVRYHVWPENELVRAHQSYIDSVMANDPRWSAHEPQEARGRLLLLILAVQSTFSFLCIQGWPGDRDLYLNLLAQTCSDIAALT